MRNNLVIQFSVASFIAMAIIAAGLVVILSAQIRSNAVDDLVEEAIGSTSARVIDFLAAEDFEHPMTGARYDRFHDFFHESIVSERTARIKLWASDGTIIFSDDRSQVGHKYPNKENLRKALDGEIPVEISVPKDADNDQENHLGTLMEVYTPVVFPGSAQPVGSIEIYQYYAPTAARISSMRNQVFLAVGIGFGTLYFTLVLIVWGGWKTIVRQRRLVEATTKELTATQGELVRSEKLAAMGQMSGGMAHDLRNPLAAIRNANYLLKRGLASYGPFDENHKLKKCLEIIDQEVDRSNHYITELLNFANIAGPSLVETKLEEVLEDSLATLGELDRITITKDLDADIRLVMADSQQLQRVFLNLANNAKDAMLDGGELAISIKNVNNHVAVTFIDSGIGITPIDIAKVFDPLFTTKTQGTGLGLAICREIVEKHGGTIRARPNEEPTGGSIFEVKLPAIPLS